MTRGFTFSRYCAKIFPPVVTVNAFGKGRAIYVAVPSQTSVIGPLVRGMYADLGVERGPETPPGVYARVVEGRTLYVNTTDEEKSVSINGSKRGLISGVSYEGVIRLKAYNADLVD